MKNIWLWLVLFISVQGQSQNIVACEYFFDDDPGFGNGTSLSVTPGDSLMVTTTIPTTSLSQGHHKLFVRTMDEDGTWSLYEGRSVFIQGSGYDTSGQLTEAEYFYDDDPGFGNGTPFSVTAGDSLMIDTNVPTTSLQPGFHKLFVRAKNALGTWSLYEGRTIYIQSPINPIQPELTYAEYFYDEDPGLGNGTSFGVTPGDSLSYDAVVPTTGLNGGFHKLFVRAMNTAGTWSLYEWRTVYIHVPNAADTEQLTAAEYFYDTDPGIGNASPFVVTPGDSLSFDAVQDITSLDEGFHHLYVRARNNVGVWSLYEGRTFYIQPLPDEDTLQLVAAEYYFDAEPGIGLGTLLDVIPGDSIDANFTVPQSLPTGLHTMFLRVKASNGDWSLFEARTFDVSVGIDELTANGYELYQNYPNPFQSSTQLEFYLSKADDVTIEITDVSGKVVRVIPLKKLNSGQHKLILDAGDLAEGSYCYRMITPTYTETKQMLLVR